MPENNEDIVIKSAEQFDNVMKKRRADISAHKLSRTIKDNPNTVNHAALANQWLKVINLTIKDRFIKNILTQRIVEPLKTGKVKSHMSLAVEMRMTVDEVIKCEDEGKAILFALLEKCCSFEFIEKFNRDKALRGSVRAAIKDTGI